VVFNQLLTTGVIQVPPGEARDVTLRLWGLNAIRFRGRMAWWYGVSRIEGLATAWE
jgi:hypothetical protein